MDEQTNYSLPDRDWPLLEPFWQACQAGELKFQRCACGHWQWYPTYHCPECGGEMEWTQVPGTARLFSWSVVNKPFFPEFADKVPLIVAAADIDGAPGVRLIADIIEADPQELRLDMPLQVVFEQASPETAMPRFKIIRKEGK